MKPERISIRVKDTIKKKAMKQAEKSGFAGLTAYIVHLILKDAK